MNDYGTWTLFLFGGLVLFGMLEYRALRHPENSKRVSLSRYMATIGARFPLAIFICGLIVGGLAVHFWWRWCPSGLPTSGG